MPKYKRMTSSMYSTEQNTNKQMPSTSTIHYVVVGFHAVLILLAAVSIVPIVYMLLSRTGARTRQLLFWLLLPTPIVQVALGFVTIGIILLNELGNRSTPVTRGREAMLVIEAFIRTAMLALFFYMLVFITWSLYTINKAMDSLSETSFTILRILIRFASIGMGVLVLPTVSALNLMNGTMNKSKLSTRISTSILAFGCAGISLTFVLIIIAAMVGLTAVAWNSIAPQSRKHMKKIIIIVPVLVLVSVVFTIGLLLFTSVVQTREPLRSYLSFLGFAILVISDLLFVFLLLFVYGPVREIGDVLSRRFSVQHKHATGQYYQQPLPKDLENPSDPTPTIGFFVITVEDLSTEKPTFVEVAFVIDPTVKSTKEKVTYEAKGLSNT